jgi:hypothetical protein
MSPSIRTWALLPLSLALVFQTGCVAGYSYSPYSHRHVAASRAADFSFDAVLSPYGEWILIAPHGRVWRPHRHVVGVGFMPYVTGGQWVYTDYGWMFETGWEWGWVPFHYGRWFYAGDVQGWVWVPDTVWGPAWVEWRAGGGYVGWAPLPPRVVVGVHVAPPIWVFVTAHYFPEGRHHGRVEIGPREHPATAVIPPRHAPDGHAWYSGPSRDWVAHQGSVKVYPREYRRPDPLPPTALEPRRDSWTHSPPPGESGWGRPSVPEQSSPPAGSPSGESGWGRPSVPEQSSPPAGSPSGESGWGRPSAPERSNSPPSGESGWGSPSSPSRGNPPAQPSPAPDPGNSQGRPPPPGKGHGASSPPGHSGSQNWRQAWLKVRSAGALAQSLRTFLHPPGAVGFGTLRALRAAH